MQLEWRNKCIHRHSTGWQNAWEVTTQKTMDDVKAHTSIQIMTVEIQGTG